MYMCRLSGSRCAIYQAGESDDRNDMDKAYYEPHKRWGTLQTTSHYSFRQLWPDEGFTILA